MLSSTCTLHLKCTRSEIERSTPRYEVLWKTGHILEKKIYTGWVLIKKTPPRFGFSNSDNEDWLELCSRV